ncbi:OPT/YSL family transporter [Sphaerisporangium sp. NPDC088356]|uniref:OPT/YSL family transporter n=1 Tax=Sphaerisporangium sp. NPDC088356 TaxID=3154871 RepID=UPI00341B5B56
MREKERAPSSSPENSIDLLDPLPGWRGSHLSATLVGLGIGVLLCVLNVLVLFRTGTSFGGSALVAALGAALLRLMGALNWQALFVVFSIASSGYVATAALDTGIGAVVLRSGELPAWGILMILAMAANILGIGLGALVARTLVITERLPYPTLRPAITLMASLSSPAGQEGSRLGRTLPIAAGIGAASAAGVAAWGHEATPELFGSGTHLALALSPLLFGLGFLIGPRACAWLAAGSFYSLTVWFVQDHSASAGPVAYTQHLAYPWVLAAGVGLILGYSVAAIVRVRGPLMRSLRSGDTTGRLVADRPGLTRWWGAAALAVVALAAMLYPPLLRYLGFGLLTLLLLVTLTVFLTRAGGEIGLVPLAPALYFSVAVFAVSGADPVVAVLASSTICCAAIASVYYTYSAKVAHERPAGVAEPPARLTRWTQVVGGLAGAAAGVMVIAVLTRAGVIGGDGFPAPVAIAVQFVDSTVRGSSDYPVAVAVAMAVTGPIGAGLAFTTAMPTMLGLGVLLPPAYSLTIAAGGLAQWLLTRRNPQRRSGTEIAASGLIIGEGLVTVAVLVAREVLR